MVLISSVFSHSLLDDPGLVSPPPELVGGVVSRHVEVVLLDVGDALLAEVVPHVGLLLGPVSVGHVAANAPGMKEIVRDLLVRSDNV